MVLEKFYHPTTELVPKDIKMDTNRELSQYFIQRWQLTYMDQSLYLKLLVIDESHSIFYNCRKHWQRSENENCLQKEADE